MNNVVFVCQIIPDELLGKYPVSPAQTSFCNKIIATGYFNRIVSLVQTNVKPYMIPEIKDCRDIDYVQVRWLVQNKITRLLNNLIENLLIVRMCSDSEIVYNNINHQTILSCLINKLILRRKVYAIVTDHTPSKHPMSFQWVLEKLFPRLDGVITLSSRINVENSNRFSIAGIVSDISKNCIKTEHGRNPSVLFSGALSEVTGVQLALDTFSGLPDVQLVVTGGGPLEHLVRDYASRYQNISYLGFLENDKYRELLSTITVCLSLRNPSLPENNNNFPSKLLEYLSAGKFVVSTMRYPELEGVKYCTCDYNKKELTTTIYDAINAVKDKDTFINDNFEILEKKFSGAAWIEIFNKMINGK